MTAAWSLSQPGLAKACVHGECIRPSLTQTALKKSSTGTHLITSQELEGMRATHRVRRRGNPELNQELPRERGYCRLNLVAPNCTKANLQIGRARRLGGLRGPNRPTGLRIRKMARFALVLVQNASHRD
jgi:hypothetical protein